MYISLLLACGGASLETRVDELRVMAIKPIPAEITPEDTPTADILIPNPPQKPAKFLYWTCTNIGNGCLERDFYEGSELVWGQVQTVNNDSLVHRVELDIPPFLSDLISQVPNEAPFGGSFLWVLACEETQCPLIQDWEAGQASYDSMNNPYELMAELPKKGTSLAFRPLLLSNRPEIERIQHPDLTFSGNDNIVLNGPNDSKPIDFSYALNRQDQSADALYYAYATQGGFAMNDRYTTLLRSEAGTFSTDWFGTEDLKSGNAQLMIILENGEGGISFWTSDATVR
ncbi:MAG: hypothetical protein VXZ96_10750 [Myxococcota bacterium]|nr:hypothetical protein [Myxococcota bacterium]